MKKLLARFVREDEGQDLIEYALLAAFIALVAVVMIISVGTGVNLIYSQINSQVDNAAQQPT
jgi:pilus assembly protein Flp/PilA